MGVEAWERFLEPAAAATWSVALFALASLGANLSSALILRRHHGKSLGVKGAFMVAITDTVGSIGVIVSAAASILFGWAWMEPLVVALIRKPIHQDLLLETLRDIDALVKQRGLLENAL